MATCCVPKTIGCLVGWFQILLVADVKGVFSFVYYNQCYHGDDEKSNKDYRVPLTAFDILVCFQCSPLSPATHL